MPIVLIVLIFPCSSHFELSSDESQGAGRPLECVSVEVPKEDLKRAAATRIEEKSRRM